MPSFHGDSVLPWRFKDLLSIIHVFLYVSEGQCFTAQSCTVVCAYVMRLVGVQAARSKST